MNRVFRELEEAVDALEGEISRLDRGGEDWPLFFRMLRSFREFHLQCYRETLLLAIAPCYAKADFFRYSEPDWLGLSGDALTGRLPRNEFGYLHPSYDQVFLGITQRTYDRLCALYRRCPARCREEADRLLLAMIDFILDYLDGTLGRSKLSDYYS